MRRVCFILALALANPALAAEQSRTATYPVTGKTAKDIYDDIKKSSPRIAPNATFAFTAIATKTDSKTKQANKSCRYTRFKTSAFYIFNLPKHMKPAMMSAATRAKWLNFVNYLTTHEQHHRDMWRTCLADYDRGALALDASSCEALDKAREKLFTKIKLACVQQDENFDFYFRKDVLKEPFVAEALARTRD